MTKIPTPVVMTPTCPRCGSQDVIKIHRPEVYEFSFVCRNCKEAFDR